MVFSEKEVEELVAGTRRLRPKHSQHILNSPQLANEIWRLSGPAIDFLFLVLFLFVLPYDGLVLRFVSQFVMV